MRDTLIGRDIGAVDWFVSDHPIDYEQALSVMHARSASIVSGSAAELVWLLEHPPLYTAGTSARAEDLLTPGRFPVHRTGRGGQLTYHGPGQRVVYVMLNVARRGRDVRAFVCALETWIIDTLAAFGIHGETRNDRIGVWVRREHGSKVREDKIAAIGLRLRRWVSLHGLSLNVAPDLEHFSGIVPCGVHGYGVTSLADLGVRAQMGEVDLALRTAFEPHFGSARSVRTIAELPRSATEVPNRTSASR
jgi:lipoyl(octanoyl) transferase